MAPAHRPNSSSRIVTKRILLSGIAIFGFSLFTFFTAHELAWPPGEFVADTSEIERGREFRLRVLRSGSA